MESWQHNVFGSRMSNLIPADSLITRSAAARPAFELAAPNPILGKTVFLRLPISAEWSYEVDPARLIVKRNLILRDQMWVTRGEARFTAAHTSGARAEITVTVRRLPSTAVPRGAAPDDRRVSRLPGGRLHLIRGGAWRLRVRCHITGRQIDLRWRISGTVDFAPVLEGARCH